MIHRVIEFGFINHPAISHLSDKSNKTFHPYISWDREELHNLTNFKNFFRIVRSFRTGFNVAMEPIIFSELVSRDNTREIVLAT